MARCSNVGSVREDEDSSSDGKGDLGFAGTGSSSVWLRATVEYPREEARERVWRRRSEVVEGDHAMLRS